MARLDCDHDCRRGTPRSINLQAAARIRQGAQRSTNLLVRYGSVARSDSRASLYVLRAVFRRFRSLPIVGSRTMHLAVGMREKRLD